MRVRFATPPARGERFSVSYLAPGRKRRTYKTVQAKWPGGSARTITSAPLPARAYRQRRGRWRAVLKVDGRQMSLVAFRIR